MKIYAIIFSCLYLFYFNNTVSNAQERYITIEKTNSVNTTYNMSTTDSMVVDTNDIMTIYSKDTTISKYNINVIEDIVFQDEPTSKDNIEYKLLYEYKTKTNYKNVCKHLIWDNNNIYSLGKFGIRKFNFSNLSTLSLVQEKTFTDMNRLSQICRGGDIKNNYLYVSTRSSLGGETESIYPEVRIDFEGGANEFQIYNSSEGISNNETINAFFKGLYIKSATPSELNSVYIYKASKQKDGTYKNIIRFKGNNKNIRFISDTYNSQEEALSSLKDTYRTTSGDYCIVDWNTIKNSGSYFTNVTFNYLSEYDSYMRNGDVSIDEQGIPCPNKGQHSARLMSGNIPEKYSTAVLKRNISNTTGEYNLSFWIRTDEIPTEKIKIPLMCNDSIYVLCINIIHNSDSSYQLSYTTPESTHISCKFFSLSEWYNIKISLNNSKINAYWREKECGEWNKDVSDDIRLSSTPNAIALGISTTEANKIVYIDDFYYHQSELDSVSYINGKLDIVDKSNLTPVCSYYSDIKFTDLKIYKDYLILDTRNGFNIYNLNDGKNIELLYSYHFNGIKEHQGFDVYEHKGRTYLFTTNYTEGATIFDITNPKDVKVVKAISLDEISYNGMSLKGKGFTFDVIIDYPYAYTTYATALPYKDTPYNYTGLLTYDISDLNNIKMKLTPIPDNDECTTTSGDPYPNRITRYKDWIVLNNAEKGFVIFDINNAGNPIYNKSIASPNNSVVLPICHSDNGYIFTGSNAGIFVYTNKQ